MDEPTLPSALSVTLTLAADRVEAALDRPMLIDAMIDAIRPFGFTDALIVRFEWNQGFAETTEVIATFVEFYDYVDLDMLPGDPAGLLSQYLARPTVVPFDLSAWRLARDEQRAALDGPLGGKIGTRLFLPGVKVDEACFYTLCFCGGTPDAGQGIGEAAMLWSIARVVARRLAQLDGAVPSDIATAVPVMFLIRPDIAAPITPAESGLVARQKRLMERDRPPGIVIIRPRRASPARTLSASSSSA